jgi:hypothetical protein
MKNKIIKIGLIIVACVGVIAASWVILHRHVESDLCWSGRQDSRAAYSIVVHAILQELDGGGAIGNMVVTENTGLPHGGGHGIMDTVVTVEFSSPHGFAATATHTREHNGMVHYYDSVNGSESECWRC